jgi:hypothetical protein
MIVDAFKDTLELGLEKPKQVVVRFPLLSSWVPKTPIREWVGVGGDDTTAYETWNPSPPMRPLRAPLFLSLRGMYD